MNLRPHILFVFTFCIFGISSCATNPRQKRISNNPDLYNNLSSHDKSLVNNGQIKQGMNKKAVYLAWGDPSRSSKGDSNGTLYEKWYYYRYTPNYSGSFYGGYGYGRSYYGMGAARATDYSSELESQVEFRKGRVYSWESAK